VTLPRKRRARLAEAIEGALTQDFIGRILPFDSPAATADAQIAADRSAAGRPISQIDAQIASIARSRSAMLATRNLGDFKGFGLQVTNPWQPVDV
jgi:toxin FitB